MITPNKFLIISLVACAVGTFLGFFDNASSLTNISFLLGWFSLYKIIDNQEIFNKNMDKIEKRLDDLENK